MVLNRTAALNDGKMGEVERWPSATANGTEYVSFTTPDSVLLIPETM